MVNVFRIPLPPFGDVTVSEPWSETAFTRFENSLSESISDGVNRSLTTKDSTFDVREVGEAVAELPSPEIFEFFAMLRS